MMICRHFNNYTVMEGGFCSGIFQVTVIFGQQAEGQ